MVSQPQIQSATIFTDFSVFTYWLDQDVYVYHWLSQKMYAEKSAKMVSDLIWG